MAVGRAWGLWGTVALGVCYEAFQGVVLWRYTRVGPLEPFDGVVWVASFAIGLVPIGLVWQGVRLVRRTPVPEDVAQLYVGRWVAFANAMYIGLSFVHRLVVLALEHGR
jgi:hypothetical protein